MALFSLDCRIFEVGTVSADDMLFFPVGSIKYDKSQVKKIDVVAYDGGTDEFAVYNDGYAFGWVLYTSISSQDTPSKKYSVRLYFEYTDVNGVKHNTLETFTIYGFVNTDAMPYIKYIDGIASKINTTASVVLYGGNFNEDLSIFIYANDGNKQVCYMVPQDEVIWDLENNTASFMLHQGMLGSDSSGNDSCGTYEINLGYGDCDSNTLFPNSPESNLALIRYKFSSDDVAVTTTTSEVSVENNCYFKSDMRFNVDDKSNGVDSDSDSATQTYGQTMYVKIGGEKRCSCDKIKYYRVRLKYNTRLERREGEIVLNGVQLKAGDIVWLAAQFDDTDGLWVVQDGEWLGLESLNEIPVDGDTTDNPCAFKQIPLEVDCTVFVDLGVSVNTPVKYVCSDDVPRKYGSQYICSYKVVPGDIVALTNQADGNNGIWEVTCGDWNYLGPYDGLNGTSADVSREVIVQNNIDFCKCGGIFYIDYYYLNGSCYLNHLRRTVKIICTGASIAPNAERQFIITDYQISTGENDELVGNNGRTPGDPVPEDCVKTVTDYDSINRITSRETSGDCEGADVIIAPNCSKICDCSRYYNLDFTDTYNSSRDGNGFTITFWQNKTDGWHLFAYIGSGTGTTGLRYYVYHLHVKGAAKETKVDVNEEVSYMNDNGELEKSSDAWFVVHDGVLADGFGLVDDSWEFIEYNSEGDPTGTYTHILSENNLYQKWSIKCTTTLLAHRTYDEAETKYNMRRTCNDMLDPVKLDLSLGYLYGMEHIYGFKFYKTVMSKREFCDLYNSYNGEGNCIYKSFTDVIATDNEEMINTDDNETLVP